MLLHYVEAHKYLPPEAFCRAIVASPLPGTEEYRKAVERFRKANLRAKCQETFDEYFTWKRKHRRFLGVAECLRINGLAVTPPGVREGIEWELYDNAKRCADEFVTAYNTAKDGETREMLLSVMADAGLAEMVPIFAKCLRSRNPVVACIESGGIRYVYPQKSPNWLIKHIAVTGLRNVDNSESRAVLRKAHIDSSSSQASGRKVTSHHRGRRKP